MYGNVNIIQKFICKTCLYAPCDASHLLCCMYAVNVCCEGFVPTYEILMQVASSQGTADCRGGVGPTAWSCPKQSRGRLVLWCGAWRDVSLSPIHQITLTLACVNPRGRLRTDHNPWGDIVSSVKSQVQHTCRITCVCAPGSRNPPRCNLMHSICHVCCYALPL